MFDIHDFNDIRPFLPEELPFVYDRLLSDPDFIKVATFCMPSLSVNELSQLIRSCKNNLEFQLQVGYGFVQQLLAQHSVSITADFNGLDIVNGRYTFISNHRDIVLDSAILAKLLVDHGSPTTCEIAIGDNLLSLPWVKDLVRINKSFIVYRSLPARELLAASEHMSAYMHYVINKKHDNIWIAQREGRAKDSDDRTQSAIIKMLSLAPKELSPVERLRSLHIVPLAISYEYDPCDYLKAREMQLKRDDPNWKKSAADDVLSMQTGIMGNKGRIAYCCGSCLDEKLDVSAGTLGEKNRLYENVAKMIDEEIHRHYTIFPSNMIAYSELMQVKLDENKVFQEDIDKFDRYIEQQIAKIDICNPDYEFLRTQLLTMYANPYINHLRTKEY